MKKACLLSLITCMLLVFTAFICLGWDAAALDGNREMAGLVCSHSSLGDWEVFYEPSMLTPGLEVRRCTICGERVESRETLSYMDYHDLNGCEGFYEEMERIEPTCTEEGSIRKSCWFCSDSVFESIPAKGHTPGEWVTTEYPDTGATTDIQPCVDCGVAMGIKGKCGDKADWVLKNGKLTISGTGDMYDFSFDEHYYVISPWEDFKYDITEVTVSDGITYISENAFYGCYYLTEVLLPDSVTTIGQGAFALCKALEELELPKHLISLNDGLYETAIKEIYIPAGVSKIAFNEGFVTYIIDESNPHYSSYQNVIYDEEMTTLIYAPKAAVRSGFVIPDGVTTVPDWSLADSHVEVGNMTFPASVTYIGEQFWNYVSTWFSGKIYCYKGSYAAEYFADFTDILVYLDSEKIEDRFTDIKASAWFYDSVDYVVKKGYMNGMSDTQFSPNSNITREQFVLILANIAEVDTSVYKNTESGFEDVKTGQWYSGAVAWAVKEGYVSGVSATKFGRGQSIQRAALARMLYNYAGKNGIDTSGRADLSSFGDAKEFEKAGNAWMVEPVQWAVDAGIISGMKVDGVNCVNPKGTATRAQAARMLMVFDENK